MSLSRSLRGVLAILPMAVALGALSGCDNSSAPQTPEYPKVGAPPPASATKATPAKGMDRVGSDSGVPNP
jgi:hypothetical protein